MGYSTDFEGTFKILPRLTGDDMDAFNDWLVNQDRGGELIDWELKENGKEIGWNGSEKSYYMDKLIVQMEKEFFNPRGYRLEGTVLAQGEAIGDVWRLVSTTEGVKRLEGTGNEAQSGEEVSVAELELFVGQQFADDYPRDKVEILLKHFVIIKR